VPDQSQIIKGIEEVYGTSMFDIFSIYNFINDYTGILHFFPGRLDVQSYPKMCSGKGTATNHPIPFSNLSIGRNLKIRICISNAEYPSPGFFHRDFFRPVIVYLCIIGR